METVRRIAERAPAVTTGFLAVLLLITVGNSSSAADRDDKKDAISNSVVQQGFAASPIPFEKLNLAGKDRAAVALGSYLVNGVGDCVGCHTFPRFLRPGGTLPGTNGNATGNVAS